MGVVAYLCQLLVEQILHKVVVSYTFSLLLGKGLGMLRVVLFQCAPAALLGREFITQCAEYGIWQEPLTALLEESLKTARYQYLITTQRIYLAKKSLL